MYIISLLSLFRLRQTEPDLLRPYLTPLYPVVPVIALTLSIICLLAILYYNPLLSGIFCSLLGISWVLYRRFVPQLKEQKTAPTSD